MRWIVEELDTEIVTASGGGWGTQLEPDEYDLRCRILVVACIFEKTDPLDECVSWDKDAAQDALEGEYSPKDHEFEWEDDWGFATPQDATVDRLSKTTLSFQAGDKGAIWQRVNAIENDPVGFSRGSFDSVRF